MSNEYPINLMYEGIADLLCEKGEIVNVTGTEVNMWEITSVEYGGYEYTIIKCYGVIVDINRSKGGNK